MTRLILIRHGLTIWNSQKRYCGRKDIGLSGEGKLQVERLRNRLNSLRLDKIYCSSRKRAIQSARILFKRKKIIRHHGLREISFGILEGLTHEEIVERHADIYKKWIKDCFKNRIPGAEPMNIFKKRIEEVFRKIAKTNKGKTVAVVCHGGVIGIFVNGILRKRNFWRCIPSPASVTMVEYKKGKPGLKKFNDTAHLEVSNG